MAYRINEPRLAPALRLTLYRPLSPNGVNCRHRTPASRTTRNNINNTPSGVLVVSLQTATVCGSDAAVQFGTLNTAGHPMTDAPVKSYLKKCREAPVRRHTAPGRLCLCSNLLVQYVSSGPTSSVRVWGQLLQRCIGKCRCEKKKALYCGGYLGRDRSRF